MGASQAIVTAPKLIVRPAAAKIERWKQSLAADLVAENVPQPMVKKIQSIFRTVASLLEQSRMGNALLSAFRVTTQSLGRVLHQLWLEVTGFTFLAIALIGAMAGMREYSKYQSHQATGPGRLLLAVCFTISFAWFGLSSFWRIKRKKLRAKS